MIEDEKVHRDLLFAYVERWGTEAGKPVVLYGFENGDAFWFQYDGESNFDIIFIDIQMPGMNGMELAHKIREKDEDIVIVFTTGMKDYLEEGYEVEALYYLVKPLKEEKVRECLQKASARRRRERFLVLHVEGEALKVREESVNYVEARGHGCVLGRRQDTPIEVRESISEMEKLLEGDEFIKCHRSYLCRIGNIYRIEKYDIIFDDGSRIPVSRRLHQQVNRRFITYFRKGEQPLDL